jgi:hypothetical protein
MKLDDIPQSQTDNFPTGVSEEAFVTKAELYAFKLGLHYADDIDVDSGEMFQRENEHGVTEFVVRIRVGDKDELDNVEK